MKIGNLDINKIYLGTNDNVKVYLGDTKLYPTTHEYQVCYAVVNDITQYSDREFEDVYDKATTKWYKLNNLNQYEEYGIYGTGRNITTYEGKLTIDNGNEYEWDGTSWINLGATSGGTLPNVPFVLNYNAKEYDASTHTIPYTQGALNTIDAVITGNTSTIIDHSNDGYIDLSNSNIRAQVGTTNFLRSNSNPQITIICKAYVPGSSNEGNVISNRNEDYNWMYRHKSSIVTFHGTSEQGSINVSNLEPNTCSVRVDSNRMLIYNNWTQETTSTYNNFSYGGNSNGGALFCGYYSTNNEFWNGNFYWVYMSLNTLTDEEVQQVINYNEYGSSYPQYYTQKSEPINNLHFSSIMEADAYAYNNCVYDGLKAIINADIYIFDSENGWIQQSTPTYFAFKVTSGGSIKWSGSTTANTLSYSKDNGSTWTTANSGTTIIVTAGDKVLWKGTPTPQSIKGIGKFSGDTNVRYSVEGNVMSLLFGDDFGDKTSLSGKNYALYGLFSGNTNVTSAENLSLPATTLASNCYRNMFEGCSNLTTAPQLLATTLNGSCYNSMFNGCTSLTTAPELPATTLARYCYSSMFNGCTSLTTAPELPATTLANYCYQYMFYGCTSLTTAPQLPATTLASNCYSYMFQNCSNLTTAPQLLATTLADNCYLNMFRGCTSLTTAPQLPATTLAYNCYNQMFDGCTSLTTAPELLATSLASNCYSAMFRGCTSLTTAPQLPATTLKQGCYSNMFNGCSNLTTAPELPATTLADYCYYSMFYGCRSLSSIKCLATNISASNCTTGWVESVAASGTFTKAASMNDWTSGNNGIPNGWTVVDAA